MREPTEAQFLKDVAAHVMTVEQDNGVHRCLHFGKPGTGCMHFRIVTWPGYLAFSGDMGGFVFTRTRDMLEFFRGRDEGPISTNPSYWAEKLEACDRNGGFDQFSPELFRSSVEEIMEQCEYPKDMREQVRREVFSELDDGEHAAYRALFDFESDTCNPRFRFDSCDAPRARVYSYRFLWCCYALVWAIRQWDARATSTVPVAPGAK